VATRPDPIAELSHDHGHLSALVLAVGQGLSRAARGEADGLDEVDDAVEALRDALLAHFAREEEGFFPFVESNVPALHARVHTLRVDHDAVCKLLDELYGAVRQAMRDSAGQAGCTVAFGRFEELYVTHAQAELAFLNAVGESLDGGQREQLRAILADI
jgi:hemerythrin-like domain-containing protein